MKLSADLLDQLFPFHFTWDSAFRVVQCGKSLAKLWPGMAGRKVSACVRIERPAQPINAKTCAQLQGSLILLAHVNESAPTLRGQLVVNDDGTGCFVGTLSLRAPEELAPLGLTLNDFAPHDPTLDFIALAQIHDATIKELTDSNAELRQIDKALRLRETEARRLATVAESTDNAVVIATASFEVEWVNRAFENLTGWTLQEIRGRNPGDLLVGKGTDLRVSKRISQNLRRGRKVKEEILNYRRDGSAYLARIEIDPIRDEAGRVTHFISLQDDVTEQWQHEKLLRMETETHSLLFKVGSSHTAIRHLLESFAVTLGASTASWWPSGRSEHAFRPELKWVEGVFLSEEELGKNGPHDKPLPIGADAKPEPQDLLPPNTLRIVTLRLPLKSGSLHMGCLTFEGAGVLPFVAGLESRFLGLGLQVGFFLDRLNAEKELRVQRSLLSLGHQFAGICTFLLHIDTLDIKWSPECEDRLGTDRVAMPETAAQLCAIMLDEKGGLALHEGIRVVALTHEPFVFACSLKCPDQSAKDVRILLSYSGEDPSDKEILGVIQDVSVFVAEQEALLRAETIAHLGSWRLDPIKGTMTCSGELRRILGWKSSLPNPRYEDWCQKIHKDDRERVILAIQGLIAHSGRVSLEHRIVGPNKSVRHLRCDAESDGIHGIVGVQLDITEIVEARQALLLTEQRWQLAMENTDLGVWDWNTRNGDVIYTPKIFEMLGYQAKDWPNRFETWSSRVHPEDLAEAQKQIAACWNGTIDTYRSEHRLLCADGSWKWVRSVGRVVALDERGQPIRMLGTHMNVDGEHRVAAALKKRSKLIQDLQKVQHEFFSEHRTKNAFRSLLDIVINQTNSQYGFIAEVLSKESADPHARCLVSSDISWDDASRENSNTAEASGPAFRDLNSLFEATLRTGEVVISNEMDSETHVEGSLPSHPDLHSFFSIPVFHGMEMVGLIGLANRPGGYGQEQLLDLDPVTAPLSAVIVQLRQHINRAEVEQRLRVALEQAERANRAKSNFLAIMSHEIRTPLSGMLGMAELMKIGRLSPDQYQHLDSMMQSGNALVSIIDDILDFAKIEADAIKIREETVDLASMIDSVLDLLVSQASEKGLVFASIIEPNMPYQVLGDAGRIRQVLINLVGNALKFTLAGAVTIRVERSGRWLSFSVTDTGRGLTRQEQTKLFEPFTQIDSSDSRRHGGTGLGLAICKRLVSLMKGTIGVTSRRGEGSCFRFRIPFRQPPQAHEAATIGLPPGAAKIAWVADPSPELRESVQCVCQRCGFEVREFSTAQTLLRAAKDLSKPFDLLFIDGAWLSPAFHRSFVGALGKRSEKNSRVIVTRSRKDNQEFNAVGWQFMPRPWRIASLTSLCRNQTVDPAPPKPVNKSWISPIFLSRLLLGRDHAVDSSPPKPVNKRVGILGLDLRVLVAEDNPINATVLTTILGHLGCTCKLAEDGAQAVALFREEKFDLILMDCQMPVLDGYEATRQIRTIEAKRQRGEPIRIVAVTANAFAEDQQRCLEAGMDDHLSKPFTPERLSAVLLAQNPKKPPNPPLVGSPVLSGGFEELVGIVGIAGAGKLASRWVKEVPERLARIRDAMLEGDWKRIRREAHSILGTSGLFGLSELERLARLIEAEINEMHYLSAASMEAFEAAIGKAQRALMDRIDEPARAQPAEPGAKSRKRRL